MTRSPSLLNRALPLAVALAVTAGAAQAAGNPPVFYCDAKTMTDRQAEIFTIRQDVLPSLKAVMDDPSGGDDRVHATGEYAEYSARLKELLLGVDSCKELRAFENGPTAKDRLERLRRSNAQYEVDRARAEAEGTPNPPPSAEDELLAPPTRQPKPMPHPDSNEGRPDYEPYDPTPYDPMNPTGVTPPLRPN